MIGTLFHDYTAFFIDIITGRRTRAELSAARRRAEHCSSYLQSPMTVLDLANGALSPQSYILSNEGHSVYGVDLVNKPGMSLRSFAYAFARSVFRCFLPRTKTSTGTLDFIQANVSSLPLKNESVDLVTSMAAFEHFLDVPTVLSECHRVLRTGGVIWVYIHLFTSLSGGHNVGMRLAGVSDLPEGIEPWDHLRARRLPFTVPLNEWRMKDYVGAFEEHFEIDKVECVGREGEQLLTPAILKELSDYSEEELTCATLHIAARKK